MSDVERPGQNPDQPPARSMADIARLFLDGARPVAPGAAPKRISPAARREHPQPATVPAPGTPVDPAAVRLAVAASWGEEGWPALTAAAAGLAEESSTTVAVLGFIGKQFIIDVVGAESPADLPTVRVDGNAGSIDLQIARVLFTLRSAVGSWIIAAPPVGSPGFACLATRLTQWLVVCPTDNDGLVAAYQQLKRASSVPCLGRALQAFMVGDDYAQAATVHGRLRRAAREFLGAELPLAGTRISNAAAVRLATFAVADDGAVWPAVLDELAPAPAEAELDAEQSLSEDDAPSSAVEDAVERVAASATHIANAADAVFDHLAHVLDPEERAALGADFDTPAEPPRTVRPRVEVAPAKVLPTQQSRPAAAVSTLPAPGKKSPPSPADLVSSGTVVLRAFDLLEEESADRAAQWQSIERSIHDFLPGATLLDARAPMSWAHESTLVVDADGRLHVWTLFRDGATWFALREWATEHRALLALTRRDLAIRQDAEVAVHIVMPLDHSPADALARAGGRHVSWYRLRAVQWAGRRGAIVVPAQ